MPDWLPHYTSALRSDCAKLRTSGAGAARAALRLWISWSTRASETPAKKSDSFPMIAPTTFSAFMHTDWCDELSNARVAASKHFSTSPRKTVSPISFALASPVL